MNYVVHSLQCISCMPMLPRIIPIRFSWILGTRGEEEIIVHMQYHPSLSTSPLHAEGVWVNLFYSKIFYSFRKSTYSRLGFTQPPLLFLDSENLNLLHLKTAIRTRWVCFWFCFLINLFIYLFLAALGLRCCAQAVSSCGEPGLLFVAVCGLLIAVASLVVKHGH